MMDPVNSDELMMIAEEKRALKGTECPSKLGDIIYSTSMELLYAEHQWIRQRAISSKERQW